VRARKDAGDGGDLPDTRGSLCPARGGSLPRAELFSPRSKRGPGRIRMWGPPRRKRPLASFLPFSACPFSVVLFQLFFFLVPISVCFSCSKVKPRTCSQLERKRMAFSGKNVQRSSFRSGNSRAGARGARCKDRSLSPIESTAEEAGLAAAVPRIGLVTGRVPSQRTRRIDA
jgi:hypothetical protein